MDYDLVLVVGIILVVLAFPSLLNAFSSGRPPRTAAVLVTIGGAMIALATTQSPSGYAIDAIPQVFVSVVANIIR